MIASSNKSTLSVLAASVFLLYTSLSHSASSFSCQPISRSHHPIGTALSAALSAGEGPEFEHLPNRLAEFQNLEPVAESDVRRARFKQDKKLRGRFAQHGDDLWALRKVTANLSQKLVKAITKGSQEQEQSIREHLRQLEAQDPELVYKMELLKMNQAIRNERDDDAARHSRNAMEARSQLPHYNLEGLWVGK
jgi:hypothetical protein